MAYLLTEDNIKHCTLGFLKSYYKNNSSRGFGETEARLSMVTADGIVADGYLKFAVAEEGSATQWDSLIEDEAKDVVKSKEAVKPKKITSPKSFLATFEATSQETADEIQYKVQNTLLLIDAFVIAFMIAAASYGFNFLRDQFTLNELGFFKFWAGFVGVLLASLLGYILIFRYFPRYRYIFAIEQFKRYKADEQWISYGEDVFSNSDNKYLQELKKQCMKEGLGLIVVNSQLHPTLLMTPAREYVGGTRKKLKQFFDSSAEITRNRFKWLKLPNWLKTRLPQAVKIPSFSTNLPAKSFKTNDYFRYTKSYWKQALLILCSMVAMGEIYRKELKNPNIVYLEDKEYERKVLEQTKDNQKEPNVTFLDLETGNKKEVPYPRKEVLPNTNNTIPPTTTVPAIAEQIDKVIEIPTPSVSKPFTRESSSTYIPEKAIIISTDINEYISYSCNRIAHLKGEVYLIQVAIAKDYDAALASLKEYSESGFRVNALSLSCFYKSNFEYVIYLDDIYASKEDATERANQYHQLMVAKGRHRDQTLIRVLKKMN